MKAIYVCSAAVVIGSIVSGCTSAEAQVDVSRNPRLPGQGVLRVAGTAVVYAKPDHATMSVAVVKSMSRAVDAKAACDGAMAKCEAALRKLGIKSDDMQTVSFQVMPVKEKDKPLVWKVVHRISVKMRNVNVLPGAIDAAISSGATEVSNVDYGLENILKLRSQARAKAVEVARGKGAELAGMMGVSLGRPVSVTDSSGGSGYSAYSNANFRFQAQTTMDYPGTSSGGGVFQGGQIPIESRIDVEFAIE